MIVDPERFGAARSPNREFPESWMQCYTQEEIAERENVDQHAVKDILGKMAELPEPLKPAAKSYLFGNGRVAKIYKPAEDLLLKVRITHN